MRDSHLEDPRAVGGAATRPRPPAGVAPLDHSAVTPLERAGHVVASLDTAAAGTSGSTHDGRAAWRLVTVTLGVAALAAGLLEYVGLGIAARHGAAPEGAAFWRAWSSGARDAPQVAGAQMRQRRSDRSQRSAPHQLDAALASSAMIRTR